MVTGPMITLFRALGASMGSAFLLPPGWYLYLDTRSESSWPRCHGMLFGAISTFSWDVAEVGLLPVRYHRI